MNNYFLSLVGLLFFSCGNGHEVASYKVITATSVEERSAKLIELTGENFGPERVFGRLLDILLVNATIVVKDQKNDYAFIGLKGENSLFSFQALGDGPDQVTNPDLVKIVSYDESLNKLYFFDYSNKSLSSVEIQPNSVFQKYCEVPESYWGQIQSAVNLDDSLVAVTGLFSQTKFIVFDRNNQKEVARSEYVNSFANELSEEGRVKAAPVDIKFNTNNSLIIINNPSINSIDTYSISGKLNKFYSFQNFKNISTENIFSSDYFYYYSVKSQGDVVYGLYLGVENKMIALQDLFLSSARPELHVFNLLTDELLRFRLDRVVNACVLDTKNNVVYCIDEDNEEQPLVKYEIPEIL